MNQDCPGILDTWPHDVDSVLVHFRPDGSRELAELFPFESVHTRAGFTKNS